MTGALAAIAAAIAAATAFTVAAAAAAIIRLDSRLARIEAATGLWTVADPSPDPARVAVDDALIDSLHLRGRGTAAVDELLARIRDNMQED